MASTTTYITRCRRGLLSRDTFWSVLDPETVYNNIFFTIATAAIAKTPLYYNVTFENYRKMSLEGYTFYTANI